MTYLTDRKHIYSAQSEKMKGLALEKALKRAEIILDQAVKDQKKHKKISFLPFRTYLYGV